MKNNTDKIIHGRGTTHDLMKIKCITPKKMDR